MTGRVLYEAGFGGPHRQSTGDVLFEPGQRFIVVHEEATVRWINTDAVIDVEFPRTTGNDPGATNAEAVQQREER